MPSAPARTKPLSVVCGEDDFGVKQRARQIFQQWRQESPDAEHETIDAAVTNSGEALRAICQTARSPPNTALFRNRQAGLAQEL